MAGGGRRGANVSFADGCPLAWLCMMVAPADFRTGPTKKFRALADPEWISAIFLGLQRARLRMISLDSLERECSVDASAAAMLAIRDSTSVPSSWMAANRTCLAP